MEGRIAALLDEKDVMLGAIGHDLKTPLARAAGADRIGRGRCRARKMAASIEDITRSLDDILSLARVGRPSRPARTRPISPRCSASVVEEYEDMGEPSRARRDHRAWRCTLRATWLRRALRNLIGNALRYGEQARVSLGPRTATAVIRIEDDGPGIPDGEIAAMLRAVRAAARLRATARPAARASA